MAKLEVSPPKPCRYRRPSPAPVWLNSTIASPRARISGPRAAPASVGAGVGATVDQHVLPGDVAGLRAAQESAGGAEFLGGAEALGRDRVHPLLAHFLHRLAGLLRTAFQRGLDAVGVEHAGQQVVDDHVG